MTVVRQQLALAYLPCAKGMSSVLQQYPRETALLMGTLFSMYAGLTEDLRGGQLSISRYHELALVRSSGDPGPVE